MLLVVIDWIEKNYQAYDLVKAERLGQTVNILEMKEE
jgi:hypothetical protein